VHAREPDPLFTIAAFFVIVSLTVCEQNGKKFQTICAFSSGSCKANWSTHSKAYNNYFSIFNQHTNMVISEFAFALGLIVVASVSAAPRDQVS